MKIYFISFFNNSFKNSNLNNDPLFVINQLYTKNDKSSLEHLKSSRINPNFDPNLFIRDDLEFFVPQIW